jgi:hypothetical protein
VSRFKAISPELSTGKARDLLEATGTILDFPKAPAL